MSTETFEKEGKAHAFATQLRRLADAIDAHPLDIPVPSSFLIDVWTMSKEEMAAFARAAGSIKKTYGESWIEFRWKIGEALAYSVTISRDRVCRLEETGETEYVPEKIEPARIISKMKWVCDDPSFLEPSQGAVTDEH